MRWRTLWLRRANAWVRIGHPPLAVPGPAVILGAEGPAPVKMGPVTTSTCSCGGGEAVNKRSTQSTYH